MLFYNMLYDFLSLDFALISTCNGRENLVKYIKDKGEKTAVNLVFMRFLRDFDNGI